MAHSSQVRERRRVNERERENSRRKEREEEERGEEGEAGAAVRTNPNQQLGTEAKSSVTSFFFLDSFLTIEN